MSIINAIPLLAAAGGDYQISRSVRLRSSASAYFSKTLTTPTNNKIFTWSGWIKRGLLGSGLSYPNLLGTGSDELLFYSATYTDQLVVNMAGGVSCNLVTTQVFRDPSAWYHIIVVVDTTQATASNRVKVYVNGVQITAFTVSTYPSQNYNPSFNSATAHALGNNSGATRPFDGYLTEVNFIDGQALTPSSFGETDAVTGVWKPKKYAGTYGTNGFYLNFSDNSAATAAAIGKDYSGNGNNWTPNNISVTAGVTYDSMLDVPTMWADGGNGRGNYCVLSPIDSAGATISDGNLKYTLGVGSNYTTRSTIGMTTGKWYAEWTWTSGSNSDVGIATAQASLSQYLGQNAYGWIYYNDGNKYTNGSGAAYGATYANGDVIGIAFDADAGTLTFYKNGTSQGVAFTGLTSGPYFFAIGSSSTTGFYNFGQRPFAYTPPTGFKALNTNNLPEPTIKKGNQYFDATTYTGTGSTQSIVNNGAMQPDFVWVKSRNNASNNLAIDAVRGGGKILITELTDAEYTGTYLSSFNSNGFTIGATASSALNASGYTYVGWQWKESVTAGFDIVTYTGDGTSARAISHSLGVATKMVIVKTRSLAGENWNCWHTSLGNTAYRILLNTTGAVDTGSPTIWGTGGINPTSTTFQVGSSSGTNGNTSTYVAYLFSEVAGYSKFGSYTGNGSADGPFVFLGFRPKFVMVKRSDSTGDWVMVDTSRDTYNYVNSALYADQSYSEGTVGAGPYIDALSNGFKNRSTFPNWNASGGTYIFAAFAESPFKTSLAR